MDVDFYRIVSFLFCFVRINIRKCDCSAQQNCDGVVMRCDCLLRRCRIAFQVIKHRFIMLMLSFIVDIQWIVLELSDFQKHSHSSQAYFRTVQSIWIFIKIYIIMKNERGDYALNCRQQLFPHIHTHKYIGYCNWMDESMKMNRKHEWNGIERNGNGKVKGKSQIIFSLYYYHILCMHDISISI